MKKLPQQQADKWQKRKEDTQYNRKSVQGKFDASTSTKGALGTAKHSASLASYLSQHDNYQHDGYDDFCNCEINLHQLFQKVAVLLYQQNRTCQGSQLVVTIDFHMDCNSQNMCYVINKLHL